MLRTGNRILLVTALLSGLLATGCDETAIYLVLHSRLKIPSQLDAVCLGLAAGGKLEFARRYPLTAAHAGAPLTLSVVAGERNNRAVEVTLRGERRGWPASWLRKSATFEESEVRQVDLHIEACQGSTSAGKFSGAGRLTSQAGSQVALMPVPYARGQMVVVWVGGGKRFAMLGGTVHEKPSGAPQVGSAALVRQLLSVDLDADCDLDLVLLLGGGQPEVWINDGDGAFARAATGLPGPGSYRAAAAADINDDGALDLVFAGRKSVTLLLGSAAKPGTFVLGTGRIPTLGDDEITSLALGLVNDDAHVDMVLGRGDTTPAANLLLVNDTSGSGTFKVGPAFSRKARTVAVALNDLNGDGTHELVVGNAVGTPSLVFSNVRGTLDQKSPWSITGSAVTGVAQVLMQDLDNDCAVDLALATASGPRIWLNRGKLTFAAAPVTGADAACTNLSAGDVDGDGQLDLVVGGHADGATWLRQR